MPRIRPGALWALAISFSLAIAALCLPDCAFAIDRTLSWDAVMTDSAGKSLPAGVTVTYNLYGATQGQPLKLIANMTTTKTVRSNQDVGTACYAITAFVTPASAIQVQESAQTATNCDTIAAPPPPKPAAPAAPTGFQIKQTSPPTSRYAPFARKRMMVADAAASAAKLSR